MNNDNSWSSSSASFLEVGNNRITVSQTKQFGWLFYFNPQTWACPMSLKKSSCFPGALSSIKAKAPPLGPVVDGPHPLLGKPSGYLQPPFQGPVPAGKEPVTETPEMACSRVHSSSIHSPPLRLQHACIQTSLHSSFQSFHCSFIHTFIEYLLCTWHYSRPLEYKSELEKVPVHIKFTF